MASLNIFINCLMQVAGWLLVLIFAAMASLLAGTFFSCLIKTIRKVNEKTEALLKFLLSVAAVLILINIVPIIELVKTGWDAWKIAFFVIEAIGALIGIISGCLHNGHDFEFDR